jgi:hypothetical protein
MTTPAPTQPQDFEILKKDFISMGLDETESKRMARLFTFTSTEYERKRWIEVRVLTEDGKQIIVDEEFDKDNSGIQVCLFNMAYNGLLTRVQRGGVDQCTTVNPRSRRNRTGSQMQNAIVKPIHFAGITPIVKN